jgi:hypothetical protein
MPRISLISGAYSAPSLIASAQRCINLFPEKNPEEIKSPAPMTHYTRPGLTPLGVQLAPSAPGRCLYTATNGDLYAVVGQNVYYINPDFGFTQIGQLSIPANTPVYISDNGQTAMLVDGSPNGYQINLAAHGLTPGSFARIIDPNFNGADRIDFLDGYLVWNQPGTPNWQSTLLNQIAFNGLFFGTKTAWPDNIISIVTLEREAWLFGPYKTEIWFNAGTVPFPFQIVPGNIIEQGCAAKYSPAKMDVNVYWLSQTVEGDRMVMRGNGHSTKRISTHAMEAEFRKYPRISDAIGSCYQIQGHSFYGLHFPLADKTWQFDESTQQWFEDNAMDSNGALHRSHVPFVTFAYGINIGLDFATGTLYQIDSGNFTDNGAPIPRIRSFPHFVADDFERVSFWRLLADMEVGAGPGTISVPLSQSPWSLGWSSGFGPTSLLEPPLITLRVSRTRGASYDNGRMQLLGAAGRFFTRPTWNRLGMASDMVVELSWSTALKTALNGAFLTDLEPHEE